LSQQIVATLITAGTGLLGALIGFGGSLLVSIRAERIGRQHVVYARAYEHRTVALVEYYGILLAVNDAFFKWLQGSE
jgi:hypothetical protein